MERKTFMQRKMEIKGNFIKEEQWLRRTMLRSVMPMSGWEFTPESITALAERGEANATRIRTP